MTTKAETQQPTMTLTRVLDAPRELVWKTWTDSKLLAEWWSPRGFTNPVCEIDAKVDGKIRIQMAHPKFPNHWMVGHVIEIKKPERFVFQNNAVIAKDGIGEPSLEGITTVIFEDLNGKTRLTIVSVLHKMAAGMEGAVSGMNQGWGESIDKLEELLVKIKNG